MTLILAGQAILAMAASALMPSHANPYELFIAVHRAGGVGSAIELPEQAESPWTFPGIFAGALLASVAAKLISDDASLAGGTGAINGFAALMGIPMAGLNGFWPGFFVGLFGMLIAVVFLVASLFGGGKGR